jgi:hypothetical protein
MGSFLSSIAVSVSDLPLEGLSWPELDKPMPRRPVAGPISLLAGPYFWVEPLLCVIKPAGARIARSSFQSAMTAYPFPNLILLSYPGWNDRYIAVRTRLSRNDQA